VPEAEEGEAEAALQDVEVLEDTEGAQANFADEVRDGTKTSELCNRLFF
jgi:hypothetical protein